MVPESVRISHKERRSGMITAIKREGLRMKDFVDGTAFNNEQGNRARKLFAAVVLAALDDAIADDKKYGNGPEQIARWARSRVARSIELRRYRSERTGRRRAHGFCWKRCSYFRCAQPRRVRTT